MVAEGVGIGMQEMSADVVGAGLLMQYKKAKTIWNLGRFERGRRIERMLGANLDWPKNFAALRSL
ncbi:hypothetical protein GCM10022396_09100 [Flavivirga amylovorans]|uniref:hypothetical protein n=1 Tax=Flavivirga amylovorans TaxID=870486 RepID=UPI0026DF92AE|nr:hypothetical protein [Flavivirga amylovorans]